MTPLDALKRIAKFTEEHIAPQLLMKKERVLSGDVMDMSEVVDEYVHPTVTYGDMPHKNFQPADFQIPMILWTIDEVEDLGDYEKGRMVNFRAYVAAYCGELYSDQDLKLPDNTAFVDLMNALEKMYIEISRKHVINGVGREKAVNYGKYDGLYYPYTYGWLTFTGEIARMQYDDEINLDEI